MQASVFDTYVTKKQGGIMHFDIVVPQGVAIEQVLDYGKNYLQDKDQTGQALSAQECRFCHIETASMEMEQAFQVQGYYIIEMEGCESLG